MTRSLKTQLSFIITFVVLVTVALISFLANVLINEEFKNYIQEQQKQKTQELVAELSQRHAEQPQFWDEDLIHVIGMSALYDGYIIKVYDNNGKMVWDAENHDMTLCSQVMNEISERMRKRRPQVSGEFISKEYPLTRDGNQIGTVSIRYFGPYFLSENDFKFLDSLNTVLVVIGGFSVLFSFIVGWFIARRIANPISPTVDIAKQISEGNYAIRFDIQTKTKELDELVSSVNHLADSLNEQENLRKQLTADVAHELRTPLTTVGSHLESMIEGVWEATPERLQSCHEEVTRLGKLVTDLECLAKVESDNLKLQKTPVDLLEIAHTLSDQFEIELKNKNLELTIDGDPVIVPVDKDRISQVILNLLGNAVKYTPENGHIRVEVWDWGENAVLTVEDDGIGIPKEDLPFVFERFYRADKSRNRKTGGAGIGLAIVKSIVQAHKGTVEVQSRPDDGSRFIITLPNRG